MEQGVEKEIVDDQFAIYEDWMDNYQSHPMLGHRWTPDEANCVIIEMMRVNGIYETDRLVKGATAGGMTEHDALALVIDRKSTRLNSSHKPISYAVFCLKKKKKNNNYHHTPSTYHTTT